MLPITKKLFDLTHNLIYMYHEKPFQLSSGKLSNHYFNCKKITLNPEYLNLTVRAICEELFPQSQIPIPKAVGGLTMGADPLVYGISLYYWGKQHTCYPCIVRKETKEYGTKKLIEGEIERFDEVIVLDDVVTTGASTLKAANAFRSIGKKVKYAISIVDREEGGRETLKEQGIELFSLFRKNDFL